MASAFAHAAAGAALWPLFRVSSAPRFSWVLGAVAATLPDLDVVGFRLGISYGDPLGHRGLTHSLVVALLAGVLVSWSIRRHAMSSGERFRLTSYLVLAIASHGLLDAMTTGGLGVALLAPLSNTRYFFPWRPIAVSPLGIQPFFTLHGLGILANEALWVGLPSLALAWIGGRLRDRAAPARLPRV
jgi:inner membrane protein